MDYKGHLLNHAFKPDFICYERIIVEIKALSELNNAHRSQLLNYLNGSTFNLGLLVNFGHFPRIEYERIALTENRISSKSVKDEIRSWTLD